MQHPFEALRPEYEALLAHMVITRIGAVDAAAHKLLGFVDAGRYAEVSTQTGIPQVWIAASFEREAGSNFRLNPAQGDPWDRPSVHVPRGRGPFPDWKSAAIDAYHIDGTDRVGAANWTWARACYEGEVFNGMGYRGHGIHSPYLWAGTNNYVSGKYIADGVWSAVAVDQQLGIVPMMARMVAFRPALALVGAAPGTDGGTIDPPPPIEGTAWVQASLNKLMVLDLAVDGNAGPLTHAAIVKFQTVYGLKPDGIAGPITIARIKQELKNAGQHTA